MVIEWVKPNKWFLIAMGGLLLILLAALAYYQGKDNKNTIAIIDLEGVIYDSGYGFTPATIKSRLDSVENVGVVILRINSPGGSVVASQEILAKIRAFKEKTHIPVIVSMGDLAASGGYYTALGGDVIMANAGTLTGSIGVIAQFAYMEGLFRKLGIEMETVKAGKYKDMGSHTLSKEERAVMQAVADNIYNQFTNEVATSRKMDIEAVRSLATGEIYTGDQALTLGLVDKVGTLEDAKALAKTMANIKESKEQYKYLGSQQTGLFGTFSRIQAIMEKSYRMFEQSTSFGVKWQAY